MLAGVERAARESGVGDGRRRDDQRIAFAGERVERAEHAALADLADQLRSSVEIEIEHADELGVRCRGEFLGVIATEHTGADNANADLAAMATDNRGRSGRMDGTLH
jgi:hypothetical protein